MAIIKCPECKGKMSTEADACPTCGYKLKETDRQKALKKQGKTSMLTVVILIAAAVYLFAPTGSSKGKNEEQEKLQAALTNNAIAVSQQMVKNKYGEPAIKLEAKGRSCSVVLTYPKDPMPYATAKAISMSVVEAFIDTYIKNGKNPYDNSITIYARIQTVPPKSQTGQDMVRVYGVAAYGYATDKITWKDEQR